MKFNPCCIFVFNIIQHVLHSAKQLSWWLTFNDIILVKQISKYEYHIPTVLFEQSLQMLEFDMLFFQSFMEVRIIN
jgi:hypothetical protein